MKKLFFSKRVVYLSLILIVSSIEVFAGPRDHNGGFFLRLSAGSDFAQTELGDPATMKYSGPCGDVNFAIGGVVLPNLAVHGTLFGWSILDPTLTVGEISGELNGTLILSAVGIGVTYYFMPINIYISPSIGIGKLFLESGGTSSDTEMGLAFDMTLGKEWWVGGSWGLGVAGAFGFHSIQNSEASEVNWNGYSLGLRFTATLN